MAKIPVQIYDSPPRLYGSPIFHIKLPSILSQKNTVIETILTTLKQKKLIQDSDEIWVRLCLDEVLVNAIRHGNKENPEKVVGVTLYSDNVNWAIRVEDEGDGFSPDDMISIDTEEYWESEHGRGILLIKSYMDEIWYYDKGNKVQLAKLRKNFLKKFWDKMTVFFSRNKN